MPFSSNIAKLRAFSFLKMTLFPMAIITLFWKDHIGLSLTEILVLQGFFSLATLLFEFPSGYLSDRLGYRFSLNLASLLGICGWGWYLFAGSFAEVLIAELLLGASFAFISGADSALLYESLRQEGSEHRYSQHEGRMIGLAQAGEAAGAIFAGTLYALFPLLPFIIQVVVWILALGLTTTLKEPPRERAPTTHSHLAEALATVRYTFRDNRRLRATVALSTVLGLASYYPVWMIQPFMQETGVPLAWFGPIWAGANATVALFSWLSYRFSMRLGNRSMAFLMFGLVACGYFGLAFTHALWSFLFYYLLTTMRGLQGPLLKAHIQGQSQSSNRASIMSLKSFAFRFCFICTGPAAGLAADRFGLNTAFAILGLALCATLILCLRKFEFSASSSGASHP
ncbi:Predicted arabinose efflux permease, MFS family [Geoalkalibacter ferrihydriticus]|uniref:Predicted arabinose efflux permease, MFS family n=1 Tax=Geoalkalibacter ferrihydriticus TaxID=392333 RepID=A0A1G9K3J9_9BACT|nr:MFS transporter [Geoalkalibacter ferrihydriticus]SDL43925.1 Predicted arabinose efflux permease, MFS family [Geoalkalibacter ferrihydriticus]